MIATVRKDRATGPHRRPNPVGLGRDSLGRRVEDLFPEVVECVVAEVSLMLVTALVVAGATTLWARREYLRSHPRAAARANARVLAVRRRVLEAVAAHRPARQRPSHRPAHRGLADQR